MSLEDNIANLHIDTKTVKDITSVSGHLSAFHIPKVLLTLNTLWIVFPYGLVMSCVGLSEGLL